MAGFTYSGLKTAVQNYLDNTEATFVSTLDTFIQTTEERVLKSVELPVFRKNVTGSATANLEYLQVPDDFLSPFSLALIDSSSNYNLNTFPGLGITHQHEPQQANLFTMLYSIMFLLY